MATPSKTKKKSSKAPVKKTTSKKTATKKKVAKRNTPAKKKTAPKKKAATTKRKPAARIQSITKKTSRRKATVTPTKKHKTKEIFSKPPAETENSSLPVAGETNTSVNTEITKGITGMNKKDLQRAAARNYDNHRIHLSNRKGGIKPTGKKPLW